MKNFALNVHGVELAHKTDDELIPTTKGFEIKDSYKKSWGKTRRS